MECSQDKVLLKGVMWSCDEMMYHGKMKEDKLDFMRREKKRHDTCLAAIIR